MTMPVQPDREDCETACCCARAIGQETLQASSSKSDVLSGTSRQVFRLPWFGRPVNLPNAGPSQHAGHSAFVFKSVHTHKRSWYPTFGVFFLFCSSSESVIHHFECRGIARPAIMQPSINAWPICRDRYCTHPDILTPCPRPSQRKRSRLPATLSLLGGSAPRTLSKPSHC